MPEFESYVDVDVDEFVSSCSSREIKELINALIEDGHLEKSQFIKQPDDKKGVLEEEFLNKLEVLSTKYYSMSEEELEFIDNLYNKYR
jgi:hypothetical protein